MRQTDEYKPPRHGRFVNNLLNKIEMMRAAFLLLCCSGLYGQGEDKALPQAPAPPSAEEQTHVIETARENALRYIKSLPDFLCTQTVSRYSGSANGRAKLEDTLEVSVGYTAKGEQYKLETINRKPTTRTFASVGGVKGRGEFGSLLSSIFKPESQAAFQWQRWTNLNGHRTHVYSFAIAQDRSTYRINWASIAKKYQMVAAYHGLVFVDAETFQVMRITTEADGIPSNWPIRQNFGTLDYGFFEIAGTKYLLPSRVESTIVHKSGQERNVSEFSRYRRFAGDASITF